MNSKDLTIGILSTTAVVLLVGLLLIHSRPAPALAAGMTTTAGRYIMTVGVASIDDEELLFLTDNSARKMIVYRFDNSQGKIRIVQGLDLEEMRKSAAGARGGNKSRRGRP